MRNSSTPTGSVSLQWLLVLFAGSGCAALIYEVVWFQLLQLVIGSSAISLGLVLGVYMGGLGLGSIALPRMIPWAKHHPLRVYACLEIGIGISGILVLTGIPIVSRMYVAGAAQGFAGILFRGIICALCLLPPTILMGSTLPALSRWLETTRVGVSRLGFLYGANIAGAVFGCLVAGFYLLRVFNVAIATYAAIAINAAVAAGAFLLARGLEFRPSRTGPALVQSQRGPTAKATSIAIGLSGLCALGAQIVWTRLLSLMLGVTVYTFSIILAVFLAGLGCGAAAGSFVARRTSRPRIVLGLFQASTAVAVAWTAHMLADVLPYWPIDPWLSSNPWFNFQVDVLRTFVITFPATTLWGASFPLALAAMALPGQDPAVLSGDAYAANTVGAITGAVGFSIVLIPWIGTRQSQQWLIGLSALAAVTLFSRWRSGLASVCAIAGACVLAWSVPDLPWRVAAYGHRIAPTLRAVELYPDTATHLLYSGEGVSATIVIAESDTGQRSYHVSGKTEATTALEDMRLQRMLANIPALIHPAPHSVLSWGFGAGITAGSFVVHPGVQRMTICELEPLVPPASTRYFGHENYNVMNDTRTHLVYDDARHYLLTTKDKFDIITSDPLDPWAKGTAALYTREFFEVIRQHLNSGGMFAQFVQLYESNEEAVKSEIATFSDVFPNVSLWSNYASGLGYDLVLLGRTDSAPINIDSVQERLGSPSYAPVVASIGAVGFHSAIELFATYAGRPSDLAPWLKNAQRNMDANLRLQYLGGLGINAGAHQVILRDILKYRRYPEDLFAGSGPRIQALKSIVEGAR